ncbi:cyclin-H-like isoform X2 [Eurytemora carolleeae]|uniref:cyclin-H-like isoform X2 n=1 Tax=Eurytemora carolleeae TaxID=1294199 RepID=UPI000C75F368|nr:cyclin-H-like isoform X2 [Eurytemora carolleeae]|eukprot:XP_023338726.1 cyclin-H-like isoform X2 [Eurytemora affinis]
MFGDETVLNKYREKANKAFILSRNEEKNYLSQEEEMQVLGYFEAKLAEFCTKFKRFYLKNSIMDYHPKEILVTSVYLATKVEEFNVSITQFVANVQGNQERATKIILNNELLLLKELNFNLTIHNPFRAVEGLLIDLKTRCSYLENVDSFRPDIDTFLDQVFLTDAVLIYAPAQIALAAIIHAASRQKQNLDSYVTDLLFKGQGTNAIRTIVTCVRQIRILVKEVKEPVKGIKALCEKLEACRNQDNNPDSAAYKRKLEELIDEDDALLEEPVAKSFRMDSDIGVKVLSPGAN